MTRLRGAILAAAVPLFLISACAQTAGNQAAGAADSRVPESAEVSPAADDLVLRVESFGGFVPAEQNVGRIPEISIYGDGRLISLGPTTLMYPGPALPAIQVQMITPEEVRELVRRGQQAGVRNGTDFGSPNIADAPQTRVTAGDQSVSVMALSEAPANDTRLTPAQRDARTKLSAFVKQLKSLPSASGVAKPVAYRPVTLAALTRKYVPPQASEPAVTETAWPGPALPGDMLNANIGIGCVEVTGTDLDKVLTAARDAKANTPWTSGGAKYAITFRPLLPEEKGCAALKGMR